MSKKYIIKRNTIKYSGSEINNTVYSIDGTEYPQYVGFPIKQLWEEVFKLPNVDGKYEVLINNVNT